MPSTKSDVLYVKFKQDSVFTVSRKRVESIANFFQQDATFVTHFRKRAPVRATGIGYARVWTTV